MNSKSTPKTRTKAKTKAQKEEEKTIPIARTNRYVVDINLDEFFQRFRLFKLEIECENLKHQSVYDCLSQIVKDGTPVTVAFGKTIEVRDKDSNNDKLNYGDTSSLSDKKDGSESKKGDGQNDSKIFCKEYYLLASADTHLNRYAILKTLEPLSVVTKTVIEIETEEDFPYLYKVMNLLLGYLPNYNVSGYYANGNFYLGQCLEWMDNLDKFGEISFLKISFTTYSGNILSINGETATFTRGDQFLKSKDSGKKNFITPDGFLNGAHKPYYVTQDAVHAFVSRIENKENLERYFLKKTKQREDVHSLIKFLVYSDADSLKSTAAYAMENIIEMMRTHYKDFLMIEQVTIKTEFFEPKTGVQCIKPERERLKSFLKGHVVYVGVYDMKSGDDIKTANKILDALENLAHPKKKEDDLGLSYVDDIIDIQDPNTLQSIPQNATIIRVMPLQEKERQIFRGMSDKEQNKYLSKQRTNKMQYVCRGIAVQDVTPKGMPVVKKREGYKREDGVLSKQEKTAKLTVENLLRQLSVKFDVIQHQLPANLLERYKGATIYYGEKKENSNSFDMISMSISEDREVAYSDFENYPYDKKLNYILYKCVRIHYKMKNGFTRDRLYMIKKGDLELEILDTNDFIFPNLDYIQKYLESENVPGQLKNNGPRQKALGVYVDVHFWKNDDEQSWSYTSGIRHNNLKGTKYNLDKKTLIREVKTNRDITPEEFESLVISNLEEGWLRKNNNSAHPAIFKFLAEKMELERTREKADMAEVRKSLEKVS